MTKYDQKHDSGSTPMSSRDEQVMTRFLDGTLNIGQSFTLQREGKPVSFYPKGDERQRLKTWFDRRHIAAGKRCVNAKLLISSHALPEERRISGDPLLQKAPFDRVEVILMPAKYDNGSIKTRNSNILPKREAYANADTFYMRGLTQQKGDVGLLRLVQDSIKFMGKKGALLSPSKTRTGSMDMPTPLQVLQQSNIEPTAFVSGIATESSDYWAAQNDIVDSMVKGNTDQKETLSLHDAAAITIANNLTPDEAAYLSVYVSYVRAKSIVRSDAAPLAKDAAFWELPSPETLLDFERGREMLRYCGLTAQDAEARYERLQAKMGWITTQATEPAKPKRRKVAA